MIEIRVKRIWLARRWVLAKRGGNREIAYKLNMLSTQTFRGCREENDGNFIVLPFASGEILSFNYPEIVISSQIMKISGKEPSHITIER